MGNLMGGVASGIAGLVGANNAPKNTYQASAPEIQKQDLVKQLDALTPQQQALTQMLMQQSQGQGPNPAKEMLKQATDNNVKQNAGMIASQKGLSPALAARLGAQNAASMNQTAAGQGATMGAQQQISAQGLLKQNLGQQQATLQQAQAAQNSAINQGQLGAQGINAGAASQNAQNASNAFGGAMQGFGSAFAMPQPPSGGGGGSGASGLLGFLAYRGGKVPKYADGGDVSWQDLVRQGGGARAEEAARQNPYAPKTTSSAPQTSGVGGLNGQEAPLIDISKVNAASPIGHTGEIGTAGGGLGSSLINVPGNAVVGYDGGRVRHYEDGTNNVLLDNFEDDAHKVFKTPTPKDPVPETREQKYARIRRENQERSMGERTSSVDGSYAAGGPVKAMLSPGERYIPPHLVQKAKHGNPMKEGTKIPGKAKRPGNNIENDIVPAYLEPGGVVLPRSVTKSANPEEKAKSFMAQLKDQQDKKSQPKEYAKVLELKKHLKTAHEALEKAHKAMK